MNLSSLFRTNPNGDDPAWTRIEQAVTGVYAALRSRSRGILDAPSRRIAARVGEPSVEALRMAADEGDPHAVEAEQTLQRLLDDPLPVLRDLGMDRHEAALWLGSALDPFLAALWASGKHPHTQFAIAMWLSPDETLRALLEVARIPLGDRPGPFDGDRTVSMQALVDAMAFLEEPSPDTRERLRQSEAMAQDEAMALLDATDEMNRTTRAAVSAAAAVGAIVAMDRGQVETAADLASAVAHEASFLMPEFDLLLMVPLLPTLEDFIRSTVPDDPRRAWTARAWWPR